MASFHTVAWIAVPASSTSSTVITLPSPLALRKVRTFPFEASFALTHHAPMYGFRLEMGCVRRPEVGDTATGAAPPSVFAFFAAWASASFTNSASTFSTNSNALTNAWFASYRTSVSLSTALDLTAPNLDASVLANVAGTLVSPSLSSALREEEVARGDVSVAVVSTPSRTTRRGRGGWEDCWHLQSKKTAAHRTRQTVVSRVSAGVDSKNREAVGDWRARLGTEMRTCSRARRWT